jgi:hypothetical protein
VAAVRVLCTALVDPHGQPNGEACTAAVHTGCAGSLAVAWRSGPPSVVDEARAALLQLASDSLCVRHLGSGVGAVAPLLAMTELTLQLVRASAQRWREAAEAEAAEAESVAEGRGVDHVDSSTELQQQHAALMRLLHALAAVAGASELHASLVQRGVVPVMVSALQAAAADEAAPTSARPVLATLAVLCYSAAVCTEVRPPLNRPCALCSSGAQSPRHP